MIIFFDNRLSEFVIFQFMVNGVIGQIGVIVQNIVHTSYCIWYRSSNKISSGTEDNSIIPQPRFAAALEKTRFAMTFGESESI